MTTPELARLRARAERDYQPAFALDVPRLDMLAASSLAASDADVDRALASRRRDASDLAALLSPAAAARIEVVAAAAHRLSVRRFGRTMRMFAPLYLSNECVSECTYCGFQVFNRDIVRRTLTPAEVAREARYLSSLGFRHLLLVAGEHPKHVSAEYVERCVRECAAIVPNVTVEVQVWDEDTYRRLVDAGCDGVVVYQETYDARVYPAFHLKGNKRLFAWRLGALERAAAAGARRLSIGTLLGLNDDWRWEVLALASHARFLMRRFWRAEVTLALPRLEPAAGFENPPDTVTDADLTLAIAALRLALPDVGIVLSTREPAALRDGLVRLGVTHMSAGSRTEPGGYEDPGGAQEQFRVADTRPPKAVAHRLRALGYDVIWKDWSSAMRVRM